MSSFVQLEATVQEATAKIEGLGADGAGPKAPGADDGSVLVDMVMEMVAPGAAAVGAILGTVNDLRRERPGASKPSKFTGASKTAQPFIEPTYAQKKQQAQQPVKPVKPIVSKFGSLDPKRFAANDPFKRGRDRDLSERANITKMGLQSHIRGMTIQEKLARGLVPQELAAQLNGARQELEKPSLEVLDNSLQNNDARAKQRLQNTAPSFQQALKGPSPA